MGTTIYHPHSTLKLILHGHLRLKALACTRSPRSSHDTRRMLALARGRAILCLRDYHDAPQFKEIPSPVRNPGRSICGNNPLHPARKGRKLWSSGRRRRIPRHHRAVARFLKTMIPGQLPWQRVLGAGGEIKLAGRAGAEQRLRLRLEGVKFIGRRIDLNLHQHVFE